MKSDVCRLPYNAILNKCKEGLCFEPYVTNKDLLLILKTFKERL